MLSQYIQEKRAGIVLYGLTPPKVTNDDEQLREIAAKQVARLQGVALDGIVMYDLQDEAERTNATRPFPFLETVDPAFYATTYLNALPLPKIIYRAIGKYAKSETQAWLEERNRENTFSVFVGAASKDQSMALSLPEAYKLKQTVAPALHLGGIAIPERHMKKHDEQWRVVKKIQNGCSFFITQAVYDLDAAKQFLEDYVQASRAKNLPLVPIIFTLTPCGSGKTLDFMKWLGIHISSEVETTLLEAPDMLEASMEHIQAVFKSLYMYGRSLGVPVGCNIESVAIRKAEIDASVTLVKAVRAII
jgi:hypothetical protein